MHESLGATRSLIGPLLPGLEALAGIIDLIGIGIVMVGFVRALAGFLRFELGRLRGRREADGLQRVRLELGGYILAGIELMIASDLIHTVLKRELADLAFVSALVAIRTAIAYFLGRELAEVRPTES